MNRLNFAACAGLAVTWVAASAGMAGAATVVSPNAFSNTVGGGGGGLPGPIPNNYGTTGNRFQEVYNASEFTALGTAEAITSIAFRARPSPFPGAIGNSVTVSNIVVTLSTTARTADFNSPTFISNTFALNVGPDVKTVYSGPVTFTTPGMVGTTGFDYVLNLQVPFTYAKGLGNLLLDVTTPDGATTSGTGSIGFAPFDYASDASLATPDGAAIAFNGQTSTSAIGANSIASVVTQFTTQPAAVPEPASIGLLAVAAVAGLTRRSGHRRPSR